MDIYDIIKAPVITEKTVELGKKYRKYVFKVEKSATKGQIKQAIEELFKVKVEKVNTANYKGKLRRRGLLRGYKSDWKKAIVTLKEGYSIDFEHR
jgi:large subunit ribosomal protein L23